MAESPQQYSARISGYVQDLNHMKVLQSTPGRIHRLIKGRSKTFLRKRPGENRWSVAEILAHLAESEIVFAYRLRLVVSAPGTPIQAFDQNVWQSNAGYLVKNPKEASDLFAEFRAGNVAFLKSLTDEQWLSFGMHSERGKESVERMVELYAGHDVNHLRQIEGIAKTSRKK